MPLKSDTTLLLQNHFTGKTPSVKAFNMPGTDNIKSIAYSNEASKTLKKSPAKSPAILCAQGRISADCDGQKERVGVKSSDDGKQLFEAKNSVFEGKKGDGSTMPKVGIEPTLCCQNGILNPARLPIPPLRRINKNSLCFIKRANYICSIRKGQQQSAFFFILTNFHRIRRVFLYIHIIRMYYNCFIYNDLRVSLS